MRVHAFISKSNLDIRGGDTTIISEYINNYSYNIIHI